MYSITSHPAPSQLSLVSLPHDLTNIVVYRSGAERIFYICLSLIAFASGSAAGQDGASSLRAVQDSRITL